MAATEPPDTPTPVDRSTSKYPSLKQNQLNALMRAIEKDNAEVFDELVWENPRYIASQCDLPVILKPNARYTHVSVVFKIR